MNAYSQSIELLPTSKYLRQPREKAVFYRLAVLYIFALYVLPQYFGVPTPVFDFTAVRLGIVFLLLFIFFDYDRTRVFMDIVKKEPISKVLLPYIIVVTYTMVFRADLNAFLNPMIEFIEFYLLIYVIRDTIGVDNMVKMIIGFIYLLIILGFVEAVMRVSPFSYLETIKGIYTGRYIRAGHYRIMSSAVHSLGYGLMLMTAMPFAGYDVEKKTYSVFRRPFLLFGIIVNIFLTGSRSSLGIMGAIFVMMIIFTDRDKFRESIFYTIAALVAFGVITLVLQPTSAGNYIMLQITSLLDSLFKTTLSVRYGADITQLRQSAAYRDLLKEIFKLDWLNPLIGRGRQGTFSAAIDGYVIKSIDSFYIADYIRYAYPGMLSYIFFLAYCAVKMLIDIFKTRSALVRMTFIGLVGYAMHLYIADSLQTLKYLYVLVAIYICCEKTPYVKEKDIRFIGKKESRYVKK